MIEQAPDTDCFYSTGWVEAEGPSGVSLSGSHLLLTSSDVDVDPAEGWVAREVSDAESLGDVLTERAWGCVAVRGDGGESGVLLALRVLQACSEGVMPTPSRLVFLPVPGAVDEAGVWGLARTARLEQPGLAVHCIEASRAQLARALTLSRTAGVEEEYRFTETGVLEVPRLQRHVLGSEEFVARQDMTYVVSAGSGESGSVAAEFLVDRGARHLALFFRSLRAESAVPPKVVELRRSARVELFACDVSDPYSVRRAQDAMVQANMPAVAGVIHTAGDPADGALVNQSVSKLKQAYEEKVGGARNVRDVFAPLDFLVLFSSAAAAFGAVGRAGGTAADVTLDALATSWSRRGEPVLSIQWGSWTGAVPSFGAIDNKLGIMALSRLLAGLERGTVCVSRIDWNTLPLRNPFVSRFTTRRPVGPRRVEHEMGDARYSIRPDNREIIGKPHVSEPVQARPDGERSASQNSGCPHLPVLVIGAGVGGIGFARRLESLGAAAIILERSDRVGGVWSSLANAHSKLQIESPPYSFDSVFPATRGDHRWSSVFPGRDEVLQHTAAVATELKGSIHFNCEVVSVRKVHENEYEAVYVQEGKTKSIRVSGVAAFTGGLHEPREYRFRDEHLFAGHVGLGVADDTNPEKFTEASVVIAGHGAFALENMRKALEKGARHVTIICRRRNLVVSSLCGWMANSGQGALMMNDVVEIMRPFYSLCGIEIESLPTISQEEDGSYVLDQSTVPPASDIYFLAQALGKLTVLEDEIASVSAHSVVTQGGREVKADVLVKCLGSHTDRSGLLNIFGEGTRVEGLWINGDPNLLTHNDRDQVPRRAGSILCSSYTFFVQAFAEAYLHFRDNPSELAGSLGKIASDASGRSPAERLLVELWEIVDRAKDNVASRTLSLCPFDRFQKEREAEWQAYAEMMGYSVSEKMDLWSVMAPTISLLHRRDPSLPVERRVRNKQFGPISVFVPQRHRVLFLPGRGTNGHLSRSMLKRAGWTRRDDVEFVIPDAPYVIPAFSDAEQLEMLGLNSLVEEGLYDFAASYREWKAGFPELWSDYYSIPLGVDATPEASLSSVLSYIKSIAEEYGPFAGVAGFCEGAAVVSAALHSQALGHDVGLDDVGFFIAMSGWRSPIHESAGIFEKSRPIDIPVLQTLGEKEADVFRAAAPTFGQDFRHVVEHRHLGKHVYSPLTPSLDQKLNRLLHTTSR
ncbi:KR domain-containing protein [Actinopolyspora sp. H202]|uniref:KR domain-containing protein n=1 Tax=Actinopolyspora sp. H202 TaxID=1500456 RepID=UPI003EE65A99